MTTSWSGSLQWHALLATSFLEVLSPETCAFCGQRRGRRPWAPGVQGPAPGLRFWHTTHCCQPCLDICCGRLHRGTINGLDLWSAQVETAALVGVVGAWKYGRMCGLARPLAHLLVPVLQAAAAAGGPVMLAPVPLHAGRRRARGFDQTLQLAVLCSRAAAMPMAWRVLERTRSTRQQASQNTDDESRAANVAGAFRARPPRSGEALKLALLDDLATTGATICAAADALRNAGWQIAWGAAIGMARRLLLDTQAVPPIASCPDQACPCGLETAAQG